MKNNKIKLIFDKIILTIFTILCICAFFLVVENLPYLIFSIIGYDEYNGGLETTSFFVCCALLGYVINYSNNIQKHDMNELETKHFDELCALTNIYNLSSFKGTCITKIFFNEWRQIQISILNKYDIRIELYLLSNTKTKEDFIKLDTHISEFIQKNPYNQLTEDICEKYRYETKLKSSIENFLKIKD